MAAEPDWTIHVRSNVPSHLLSGIPRVHYHASDESLDPGFVEETDSLGVDRDATLRVIEEYYRRRSELVAAETRFVKSLGVSLMVADFPPLAGEGAAVCGIRCVGIGNFTWKWIYEPRFTDSSQQRLLVCL